MLKFSLVERLAAANQTANANPEAKPKTPLTCFSTDLIHVKLHR